MKALTLKQLRYFEAVARHGHFGRAAQACAISQPALSMQIKELEETMGATLIERGARTVRLTEFGEQAVERARAILRSVDELADLARASRDQLVGRLRIGVIPTIAPYLLPGVIAELSRLYSDIELSIRETLTRTLLEELADGRLDTAIVALPISEPAFTEVELFRERFVLLRPGSQVMRPAPSAEELREMRLLLLEEGHCFRDQALSFCKLPTAPPREMLDASSLSTLVQMVGAGIGVTLLPEMALSVETRSARVSVTQLASPQPERAIGMIWRKSSPLAHQLVQIADVVRRVGTASDRPRSR